MKSNWINKVHIEGRVFNHTLQQKVSGENAKNPGTPFIRGILNVATDEEGINIVAVNFTYVTEFYSKSGKPNDTYKVLSQIIEDGKTWEKDGKDAAAQVRVDGDIEVNDFLGRDGNMVETKRVRGSFVHFANGQMSLNSDENKRNTFEADMLIAAVTLQEPENGNDYVNLRGYTFAYQGRLVPVNFSVTNEAGMKYFMNCDISNANPLLTKVWGNIVSTTQETRTEVESAFGAPVVNVTTRTLRAWEVVGAAPEPYEWDDESTLTIAEFKELLSAREEEKAAAKLRAEEYQASKSGSAGFPSSGSENDIPFNTGKSSSSPMDFKF